RGSKVVTPQCRRVDVDSTAQPQFAGIQLLNIILVCPGENWRVRVYNLLAALSDCTVHLVDIAPLFFNQPLEVIHSFVPESEHRPTDYLQELRLWLNGPQELIKLFIKDFFADALVAHQAAFLIAAIVWICATAPTAPSSSEWLAARPTQDE